MLNLKDFSLVKQGAEAKLYLGHYLGQRVIVKERFTKTYRHPQLDAQLTKDRLKGEVRSLIRCKTLGIRTPTIFLVDLDSSAIVMEYLEAASTARDAINANLEAAQDKLRELAAKIGEVLAKMHNSNIIHGDLTTSNILVDESDGKVELIMIDFGLGYAEGSPEDKGVDLYVLERALLSTHPNSEWMFQVILQTYQDSLDGNAKNEIIKKFEEIRMRGRKRTMVG